MRLLNKEEEIESRKARKETLQKKRAERKKARSRFFHWIFPDYKYMSSLYPTLEKMPFFLPFYWVFRGIRLLIGMLKNKDQ